MKKFAILLLLVLFTSFSLEHDYYYKEKYTYSDYSPDYDSFVVQTTWTHYDNDDRYSTYDYRHGYTYRATDDYYDRRYGGYYDDYYDKYGKYYDRDWDYEYRYKYRDGVVGTKYEYVDYLRSWEKSDCYVVPPRDKLFYIEC